MDHKAASKAKAPELAAAVALQGQLDNQAQARADALRGQNMNAVGNIANKGYDMHKEGAFDNMFGTPEAATDLGIEAGANTITPDLGIEAGANTLATDLGMEAGANSLIGTGTGGGIGAAPAAGVVNPMAAGLAAPAAAAAPVAGAVAAPVAAAAPAAAAGLGGLGAAASTALPPLALALMASQLFG